MQLHPTNLVVRLFWQLEDRHPEALAIGLLAVGALAGHLLALAVI